MTDPLETVLSRLDRWRHLPKYRLEQHVDVLFGLTLPTVIGRRFDIDATTLDVIPEFPIHHGTAGIGRKNNQSSNVDFAVFSEGGKQVFLVELKTDGNSAKDGQLRRMRRTKGKFRSLVSAVRCIAKHSGQKEKYLHLISELHQVGAMRVGDELKNLDPSDNTFKSEFKKLLHADCGVTDTVTCTPTLVLVHPCRKELNIDTHGFCCIDFPQYAAAMNPDNRIEATLARHLCKWHTPAGEVMPEWRQSASPSPDS